MFVMFLFRLIQLEVPAVGQSSLSLTSLEV